jgi:hypothetical protein
MDPIDKINQLESKLKIFLSLSEIIVSDIILLDIFRYFRLVYDPILSGMDPIDKMRNIGIIKN